MPMLRHILQCGSILLLGLFLCGPVKANDINHNLGFGLQYSGLIGYQVSLNQEQHLLRASLGLIGTSIGYDYLLNNNWSIGTTYTATIRPVYSLNINYYSESLTDGMRIGLDLGHMPDTTGDGFLSTKGPKNVIWLSAGFAF